MIRFRHIVLAYSADKLQCAPFKNKVYSLAGCMNFASQAASAGCVVAKPMAITGRDLVCDIAVYTFTRCLDSCPFFNLLLGTRQAYGTVLLKASFI